MATPLEPGHHEGGIAATIAVAEPEAVFALEAFGSAPADQRDPQLVSQRPDRDRVIGAVRACDSDTPLVDQVLESVGRVLGLALRETVLGVKHELHRSIEQAKLCRFVERESVDAVVATAGPVERGTQPSDLDRFHVLTPLPDRRPTGAVKRLLHTQRADQDASPEDPVAATKTIGKCSIDRMPDVYASVWPGATR